MVNFSDKTALVLKIAYNGANYGGFQAQNNADTVQRRLNEAAAALFGFDCAVTGCSRTDAGVHALGFIVRITPRDGEQYAGAWWRVPYQRITSALNSLLPDDIAVRQIFFADGNFHPRYDVKIKEYVYKFDDSCVRDPFNQGLVWRMKRPFRDCGVRLMDDAAANFKGTHDFTSFMAQGSSITDATRTIDAASVDRGSDGIVRFTVSADGFLYNMVRIMAGTLASVGCGKIEPDSIREIITAKDRSRAGITAPAHGLYMARAVYPEGLLRDEP